MQVLSIPRTKRPAIWDRIGLTLSGLCVVHCLAVPVFLSVLPLWPLAEAMHVWVHPVFALLLLPTTAFAMVRGFQRHGRATIPLLLSAGLLLVLAGSVSGLRGFEPGVIETLVTLAGSGMLVTGHWKNWRADRCCDEATACAGHTDHDH